MKNEDPEEELGPTQVDELLKSVLYNYGLTMFLFGVLEHQVVNLIVALNLPRRDQTSAESLRQIREVAFKRPMGQLWKELKSSDGIPNDTKQRVDKIIDERNKLAHSFFRCNHDEMKSVIGNEKLIRDLEGLQQKVVAVDEELTKLEKTIWRTNGLDYPFATGG